MSVLIRDWEELRQIPNESESHILKVNKNNGWLKAKNEKRYDDSRDYLEQVPHLDVYLSTHTFYGFNYEFSSKLLQACGFDVKLDNWDK